MKWKNIANGTRTFFITATINGWQPLFNHEAPRNILLNDLVFYRKKYNAEIHAYVVMPEHYHMVITLEKPSALHSWLRDVHSHTSNEISKWLRDDTSPKDNAVVAMLSHLSHNARGNSQLRIWQEQARAESILTGKVLGQKIEYIHANPVRRGFVENPGDWPWSSWRAYFLDDECLLPIEKIAVT